MMTAPGKEDEFDHQFIGWPCVVEQGADYKMYYHTYNPKIKKFVIGLAVAKDGLLKWTKKGAVFEGGGQECFDCCGAARRHVVILPGGGYKMWYEGISAVGGHAIGMATSEDGVVWSRHSDVPVFAASSDGSAWDAGEE